jgi:hypothetical protein
MPSLFSRSRTTSSPLKTHRQTTDHTDEFGRVPSRGNDTFPGRKDKNVEKTRTRTLSAVKGRAPGPPLNEEDPVIPDGSFFPLNLDPPGDPASPSDSDRGSSYLFFIGSSEVPLHRGFHLPPAVISRVFSNGDR